MVSGKWGADGLTVCDTRAMHVLSVVGLGWARGMRSIDVGACLRAM